MGSMHTPSLTGHPSQEGINSRPSYGGLAQDKSPLERGFRGVLEWTLFTTLYGYSVESFVIAGFEIRQVGIAGY
jgi:hypothetical protein